MQASTDAMEAVGDWYHAWFTGIILTTVSRLGAGPAAELVFRVFRAQQQARFDAGHFELRLPYVDDTELVMDVLRQGDQVQMREPLALEAAVRARLTDAAAQYNKCAGPVSPPTAS